MYGSNKMLPYFLYIKGKEGPATGRFCRKNDTCIMLPAALITYKADTIRHIPLQIYFLNGLHHQNT